MIDNNNNNPDKLVLTKCKELYEILKSGNSDYSIEKKAGMVRYLEEKTHPTYMYFEKNGRKSIKKKARGFKDKRHFFEHTEKFLRDEAERLLNNQE